MTPNMAALRPMRTLTDVYSCKSCYQTFVKTRSGEWVGASSSYCRACAPPESGSGTFAREFKAEPVEPSTPTCCNQPMQPSTSPYRWDTGELIKGKLLVCRECGEYREAETGTLLIPGRDEQFLWSWEPLHGKNVKVYWLPALQGTSQYVILARLPKGSMIARDERVDTLPIGSTLPNGETVASTTRRSR